MNLFTYLGDLLHLGSFFVLLLKIYTSKSCKGISLNTQILYVFVFIFRYLDLLWSIPSLYLWVMKIVFITISTYIVYLIKFQMPYARSYDKKRDILMFYYLLGPCVLCGLIFHEKFTLYEILWSSSYFLEAVAILPQIIVLRAWAREQQGFVELLTSHYVFALGGYRVLYLFNWIYRFLTEPHYWHPIIWITGTIQTGLYSDFFYHYIKSILDPNMRHVKIPL